MESDRNKENYSEYSMQDIIDEVSLLRKIIKTVERVNLEYYDVVYEDNLWWTDLYPFNLKEAVAYYLEINMKDLYEQSFSNDRKELLQVLKNMKKIIELIEEWDLLRPMGIHKYDEEGDVIAYNGVEFNLSKLVKEYLGIEYHSTSSTNVTKDDESDNMDLTSNNQAIEYRSSSYRNKSKKEIIETIKRLRTIVLFINSISQNLIYEEIDYDDDLEYDSENEERESFIRTSRFDFKMEVDVFLELNLEDILDDNYEQKLNGTKEELLEKMQKLLNIIRLVERRKLYYKGYLFNLSQETEKKYGITLKKRPFPQKNN